MGRSLGIVPAALLLAACAGSEPEEADPPQTPTTAEVRLHCSTDDADAPCAFEPSEVTVPVGGTVRWVNADATFHTVTSSDSVDVRRPNGDFDAVLDSDGEEFARTFTEAGEFAYYCQPHAEFMAGTVTVVAE